MQNVNFGGSAATVSVMHQLQDKHKHQQNPHYVCPVHYYGGKVNHAVANLLTPSTKLTNSPVRFAGGDNEDSEDVDITGWGEDLAATWLLSKTADKFIKASPEKYRKVATYAVPPNSHAEGEEYLKRASHSSNVDYYSKEAERKFISTAANSKTHTHKSHAYRLAAIAAKLRGDVSAAHSYMDEAAAEKWKSRERNGSHYYAPYKDIDNLNDECVDTSTKVSTALKIPFAMPFAVLENMFSGNNKKTGKVFTPYLATIEEAEESITKAYETLSVDGYDSDREWINDNDRKAKGSSTGKGLRHKFLS